MPYSTIDSRHALTFDKLLEICRLSEAPRTETASSTPVNIGADAQGIGITALKYVTAKIVYSSYAGYVADTNEWSISLEVSNVEAGNYIPLVLLIADPENAGNIQEFSFSAVQICQTIGIEPGKATPAFMRATFTSVFPELGTPPDPISVGCFLGSY